MATSRRQLLAGTLGLAACRPSTPAVGSARPAHPEDTGLVGTSETGLWPSDTGVETGETGAPTPAECDDDGVSVLAVLPFVGEAPRELETLSGVGLDGRYVVDLATLRTEADLVLPSARFYVRTVIPDLLVAPDPWVVRLSGLVEAAVDVTLVDLLALAVPMGVKHFECSGNTSYGGFGLQSAAAWDGVPLADLLDLVALSAGASHVMVVGFDNHSAGSLTSEEGASWVFPLEELGEAFLATAMNGEALPPDHGAPVRLVVPGWYGCCQIKWVTELRLVGETEPATTQMIEFAERTHQPGIPALARDYVPAVSERTAVVTVVESVELADGSVATRVVGLTWGGDSPVVGLRLHANGDEGLEVEFCSPVDDPRTWALWQVLWRPTAPGEYVLSLTVEVAGVPTNRLDVGYYNRTVQVVAV